jgi:hypothetical protein
MSTAILPASLIDPQTLTSYSTADQRSAFSLSGLGGSRHNYAYGEDEICYSEGKRRNKG